MNVNTTINMYNYNFTFLRYPYKIPEPRCSNQTPAKSDGKPEKLVDQIYNLHKCRKYIGNAVYQEKILSVDHNIRLYKTVIRTSMMYCSVELHNQIPYIKNTDGIEPDTEGVVCDLVCQEHHQHRDLGNAANQRLHRNRRSEDRQLTVRAP